MMRFGMTQWKIGGGCLSQFAGEPRSCAIISVQSLRGSWGSCPRHRGSDPSTRTPPEVRQGL